MRSTGKVRRKRNAGFTLTELLVASALLGMVMAGAVALYLRHQGSLRSTLLAVQVETEANLAMNRMVYGVGNRRGLRAAEQATLANESGGGWTLTYTIPGLHGAPPQVYAFQYLASERRLVATPGDLRVGTDIANAVAEVNPGTVSMEITVEREQGRFASRRTVATFVRLRNWPY